MQNERDILSEVIKKARQRSELTIEELANRVGVTERYLYRIENNNQKPSYNVLFRLIRVLSISPDEIFYPEQSPEYSELDSLLRQLHNCDPRSLKVVRATINALIETSSEKK